ncbi:MAG: chitobiase/beta-hexosaminidase C-terminal domain-containing protein [Candidatus Obscuribacterales bacterium]|nr:chitobiase/beta-hexosaminidase C-terminal domain-containing protein [Candidatus Obscuribacterales bacterium]
MDAPRISPSFSVFATSPQEVTITSDDPSATIRVTTDGSTPDSSSPAYSGPFSITTSTLVQAVAIDSGVSSLVTASYIQIDDSTSSVTRDGLMTWLKSDNGVITSSSNVTKWIDVSGGGNNAAQTNSSYQPTYVTGAINDLPAVSFSGSDQFLQLPAGYADFTEGISIFVAMKPTGVTAEFARILNFGNNTNNASGIVLCEITTSSYALYTCDSGGGLSNVLSNDFTLNSYQLIEALSDGVSIGTLFTNSVEGAQNASMFSIDNVSRPGNYIGKDTGSFGLFYEGEIAEILIYDRELSESERRGVEVYFSIRYSLPGRAPTITPGYTIVGAVPQTVTITADDSGATIFYTTSGDDPTPDSTEYTGPFDIYASTTIKAIAVRSSVSTPIATAVIEVDPTTAEVPRDDIAIWLRSDVGVMTSSSNVTNWIDSSGSGNDASQSSEANQPTIVTDVVNSLPAIVFSGSGQYLQLPAGLADFTAGISIFIILEPTGFPRDFVRIFQFGNNINNESGIILCELTSTSYGLFTLDASGNESVVESGLFTQNAFQLIEAIGDGASNATLYTNGIQGGTTRSMIAIDNVIRAGNFIGVDTSGDNLFFEGQIAEILIYQRELTAAEQGIVELYLGNRYAVSGAVEAPLITLPGGTLLAPSQVAICGPLDATIRFTTDGTDPGLDSGTEYVGPLLIYFSQTLKAISIISGFASSISSETYTLDSVKYPAPVSSNTTALSINLDLPTVAQ